MDSEQIIQRLLEKQQITASEALQLLKDISGHNNYTIYPFIPSTPTLPYNPIVYCQTDNGNQTTNYKINTTC
jgi:hypothetical protein